MKRILITGANSYIGTCVEKYLNQWPEDYSVLTLDMKDAFWNEHNFSQYDVIFHVAGIAHIKEKKQNASLYYAINRDMASEVAEKAKEEGVGQFIILSTMSVYGLRQGVITKQTPPNPVTHYGKSKLQADCKIWKLSCDDFRVAILRPPMVYGKGCKGNYQMLRKFALKSPFFPNIQNQRSMIYVQNLARFVKEIIDTRGSGLFFPQDADYVITAQMVKKIAENNGKKMRLIKLLNFFLLILLRWRVGIIEKVFGTLIYEKDDVILGSSFDEIMKEVEM